ncbi:hypothetical protein ACFYPA_06495 [Streptomyces sp. NPDC005775]|uniref:hypothetical protein n=1 Tax=Streptomyces sp. NPDC005775 TaxID=3364729 RepID=UPI00369D3E1F
MGIDFSHTEAHWAYTGFSRFRRALAAYVGIDLDHMSGFKPLGAGDDYQLNPWSNVTSDLKPLLDHSDCDGELSPQECQRVAPCLRQAIDAVWPSVDGEEPSYDRVNGLLLAEGMEAAAAADEPLEFQ